MFSGSYPNPFNSEIEIEYLLPETSHVIIRVFNLRGNLIRILKVSKNDSGFYRVVWNGKNEAGNSVPYGFYFYRIETSTGQTETGKIIFLK
jgi:flagellar hook assembly protein FlgD